MNFTINIITALKALRRNKMRSLLTSIGIIIGISSVIAMIGMGSSAQIAVREKMYSYGSNAMMVALNGYQFNEYDVDKLRHYLPQIKNMSPLEWRSEGSSVSLHQYKKKHHRAAVYFANSEYFEINGRMVSDGRLFTPEEVRAYDKVAVIGSKVRDKVFGVENPLGKVVMINKTAFKVIGVLEARGQALSGRDFDNLTIVPYTIGLQRFSKKHTFNRITLSTESEYDLDEVGNQIQKYCIQRFNIVQEVDRKVSIETSEEKLKMANDITSALKLLLAGIASISLFVGGVGIMNIMLVSVTERTREIGIRMAIGAKKSDIMLQFLLESIVLSVLGGIIGVLLGLVLYYAIARFIDWPFIFSVGSISVSVLFAAAVGIFFGYYPSKKAANLKPIEALRYE